jgi:hypothetical protein
MQHLAVQCPISTVQRTGKRLAINALILLRANGSFVRFSKGLHKKGVVAAVLPRPKHEGE